jgi:transposase-like protein
MFKHTDLKIAFRMNNTIENLLKQRDLIPNEFSSSGVYKLTCPDCHKAYVGQTGASFKLATKKTRVFFTTTAAPPISHNTSVTTYIPLAPLTT